ncbi:hypothetical protein R1flu_028823 [Riccia fluitans]|uniref:Uncharacterized protein n=1 Tax=Riccia fluitans TaxID=41844 RepID=A0ABD1XMS5_9MARC
MENSRRCAIAHHIKKGHDLSIDNERIKKGGIEKWKARVVPHPGLSKRRMLRCSTMIDWLMTDEGEIINLTIRLRACCYGLNHIVHPQSPSGGTKNDNRAAIVEAEDHSAEEEVAQE